MTVAVTTFLPPPLKKLLRVLVCLGTERLKELASSALKLTGKESYGIYLYPRDQGD